MAPSSGAARVTNRGRGRGRGQGVRGQRGRGGGQGRGEGGEDAVPRRRLGVEEQVPDVRDAAGRLPPVRFHRQNGNLWSPGPAPRREVVAADDVNDEVGVEAAAVAAMIILDVEENGAQEGEVEGGGYGEEEDSERSK